MTEETMTEEDVDLASAEWIYADAWTSSANGGHTRKNTFAPTPKHIVVRVYGLARLVTDIFTRLDILYWTSGGTTLGAVRHAGLIPWDDDVDLCITEAGESQLCARIDDIKNEFSLVVVRTFFGFRIFHQTESQELPRGDHLNYRYPFCDVFVMSLDETKKKKGLYVLKSREARVLWPQEYYAVEDVDLLLEKRVFGDFYVACPGHSEDYLSRTYGVNWAEVGTTSDYDHITRERVVAEEFALSEKLFLPATPFR